MMQFSHMITIHDSHMDFNESDVLGQLISSSGIASFDDSAIEALKAVAEGVRGVASKLRPLWGSTCPIQRVRRVHVQPKSSGFWIPLSVFHDISVLQRQGSRRFG